jgi:phosphohistidine phosphatase
MIEIYILRHGLAKKREEWSGKKDADRPLTGKGEKKTREEGRALKRIGISFDLIISSPFARARRTAEIVAEALRQTSQLEFTDSLTPNGSPKRFLQELIPHLDASPRVLVVGHEPYLSALISLCLSGESDLAFVLKKGGICKLVAEGRTLAKHCALEWFLTPDQLLAWC